jgi:NAD+ synthase (glutamine-hydrolysing)
LANGHLFPESRKHAFGFPTIRSSLEVFLFSFFPIGYFERSASPNGPKGHLERSLSPRGSGGAVGWQCDGAEVLKENVPG